MGLLIPAAVLSPAVVRLYSSIAHFAKTLGIEVVGRLEDLIPLWFKSPLKIRRLRVQTLNRLLKAAYRFDALLILYPGGLFSPIKNRFGFFEIALFKYVKCFTRIIAYVYDLPLLQAFTITSKEEKMKAFQLEHRFFDLVDLFMVFNEEMARYLHKYFGIESKRVVIYELFDYYTTPLAQSSKTLGSPVKILYAGNLSRDYAGPLEQLGRSPSCRYIFYGSNGEWLMSTHREDFEYRGYVHPFKLDSHVREADFGLLTYHPKRAYYMKFGHGDKFALYIGNGLPVIVHSNLEYPVKLVKKYGIGYVVDSLAEIPEVACSVSLHEYIRVRSKVLQVARKMNSGFFFKRALSEALKKI